MLILNNLPTQELFDPGYVSLAVRKRSRLNCGFQKAKTPARCSRSYGKGVILPKRYGMHRVRVCQEGIAVGVFWQANFCTLTEAVHDVTVGVVEGEEW